jgi:hypothetical protein
VNVAIPVAPGMVLGIQLAAVFQLALAPAAPHVASWAEATPETPLKTMTGIAMRAARLSTVLASNGDDTNLPPRRPMDDHRRGSHPILAPIQSAMPAIKNRRSPTHKLNPRIRNITIMARMVTIVATASAGLFFRFLLLFGNALDSNTDQVC